MVVVSGTKIAQEISSEPLGSVAADPAIAAAGSGRRGASGDRISVAIGAGFAAAEILQPLLRGTIFGTNIQHYFKIGSTNTAAMAAAAEGAPARQRLPGGRADGRTGTRIELLDIGAIDGNLLFGHSSSTAASVGRTCALAGGGAGGASGDSAGGLRTSRRILKWPNDLLIDGKKVCGILTEMNAEATQVRYIVVGIGINVNQASFPPELGATSLRMVTGSEWSRVEVVAALLKSLDREYRNLLESPDAMQIRFCGDLSTARRGRTGRRYGSKKTVRLWKEPLKGWMRAGFCRCGQRTECGPC